MAFLLAAMASATTIVPVGVERLASESTNIVRAKALAHRSQWNPQHTLIFTYTEFEVSERLKGQSPSRITVKQLGGTAGRYTTKVAGVRHWQDGEEAVLFLRPAPENDGTLQVTALAQGNFLLRKSGDGRLVASNGVPQVSAYNASSGQITGYRGTTMPLAELEQRIREAVGK